MPLAARVIANLGAELLVRHPDYGYFHARALKKHGLLVCGDKVVCHSQSSLPNLNRPDGQPHPETLRVVDVTERRGVLQRTDRRGTAKPIAANLTQVVAVTAPKPPFDPLLIDRYTIAARHMEVSLVLAINKTDLLDTDDLQAQAADIESLYTAIGYKVIRCNGKSGEGLSELASILADEVSILVGQSGVGKSSILNRMLPEQSIRTGALSEISGLGRHTTTVTMWYDLPTGGALIDSAGVRQFALEHLSNVDIEAGFVEISEASLRCKFRDCSHLKEPDCAVVSALQSGVITQQRYDHFQAISAEAAGSA